MSRKKNKELEEAENDFKCIVSQNLNGDWKKYCEKRKEISDLIDISSTKDDIELYKQMLKKFIEN